MKEIKEIKKFVIKQMKEAPFTLTSSYDDKTYESDYLKILIDDGDIKLELNSLSNFIFTLSDISLSKFRFMILMLRVIRSANESKNRNRKESLSMKWNKFLDINKELKRDSRIDNVLK